jgi:hypothetical protein
VTSALAVILMAGSIRPWHWPLKLHLERPDLYDVPTNRQHYCSNAMPSINPLVPPRKYRHVHTESVPTAVWTIAHNLNCRPHVTVVDSADSVILGDVAYLDDDTLRVTFSGAFSGKAYVS